MTRTLPRTPRAAAMALAATLAATSALTTLPSTAMAVPAGGYADLVEAVSPSVVFIEVTAKARETDFQGSLPEGMPEELRRRFEQMVPGQNGAPMPQQGLGSGFIISEDGQIVTNHHVVAGAETVTVKLADGRKLDAKVIGSDPMTDIALLKVEADVELPKVSFGTSETLRVGDEVVAVGNPFGLGGTVTSGIVSAMSRNINAGPFDDFIQTDAAINRGNSGGPLFNNDGEVIGVNTAIISPAGGSVGIGFAVPSDLVQTIVADLADDGEVQRGWLGVQIRPMTDEVATVLGYDAPKGAVVEMVNEDSPAEAAGLKKGDIILSFNGTEIEELRDLTRAVAETAPDAATEMVVLQKGEEVTLKVTVGALASEKA
ncbi:MULTISPECIES: Do family serine endopeptidase [unclassified Sulfitobacter]|jgi:serine protease Do|uniref:Do family serine endopeptidase n=3 Tax=Sulfitobacter TaxID=60136 RepID=UPI0007C2A6A6|nr:MULTISPECIES: Do family serine endopeptidase [unclassified Sulfitobacter]KZY05972.1 trypsin [Sulfitobacter sp. HI0023]KZY24557.1 trypsin [Sulfitobacter sp. HI0040]